MTTTLITGANKGLGYETARRLVAAGHDVWIGARDARAAAPPRRQLGARTSQLDVTDDASVAAAVEAVGAARRPDQQRRHLGPVVPVPRSRPRCSTVFATNVVGVVRVTQAFVPLLSAPPTP